ncbi:glutamate receptor 2.7-like [Rhododendron vialii]|uniref:glutamate receptor 2.7-like n=1 Tax=Rhododendron vialii TaxID=182163 RepID=UPI00265FC1BD|nr:glutamate receptor 2.7-like [Rhododendron vialii]
MPSLRSTRKPTFLFIPILVLFISFLLTLSQVSVVEGDCTEQNNDTLIIGVPGKASFENFVKISNSKNQDERDYSGFCIEIFQEVRRILGRPCKFVEFNGTYDELVDSVANKTYCAAVGDITILANRSKKVEFTVPFTESGLSMVVPVKPSPKPWIFLKPFTLGMWLATAAVLVYTMLIVWFVEHRSNPDFSGPWNDQLGSALWFTFSSLFLAHRERIQSNYARIVVVVWLFLALVLTQSYTANLTSMLTISRLRPKPWSPSKVGCDNYTFMHNYVRDVLNYKNVSLINDEGEYLREFEADNISAAFLEIPYAKVFVNKNCRKFTIIGTTYRFGGFGFVSTEHAKNFPFCWRFFSFYFIVFDDFKACTKISSYIHVPLQVFQKGSSLVASVSEVILELSENGTLKSLEEAWLTPNKVCSKSYLNMTENTMEENVDSLSLRSFWGLFFFSVGTSSVCFLLFLGHLLRNYCRHHSSQVADVNANNESVSVRIVRVAGYLMNAEIRSPWRSPSSRRVVSETERS